MLTARERLLIAASRHIHGNGPNGTLMTDAEAVAEEWLRELERDVLRGVTHSPRCGLCRVCGSSLVSDSGSG